jgi:hypothetical protein
VKSLEDARHLTAAIPDVEFLPGDTGDPITRPDLTREAIGLGAVPEEIGDQADRLGREFGTRTGSRVSQEGIAWPRSRRGQPLAESTPGDAQSDGDLARLPALVSEVQDLQAPPLPPVVRSSAWRLHARIVGPRSLVFHATLSKAEEGQSRPQIVKVSKEAYEAAAGMLKSYDDKLKLLEGISDDIEKYVREPTPSNWGIVL